MKYRSLSLTGFEAVQADLSDFCPIKSHRWLREKPDWFRQMVHDGSIQVVANAKDRYISLTNENATFRVTHGSYIVRNRRGLTFWMSKDLFEESFVPESGYYGITPKQQAVLDYIISCENSPTVREVKAALGYKSTSPVQRHIDCLKERGYIDKIPGRPRGIKVL